MEMRLRKAIREEKLKRELMSKLIREETPMPSGSDDEVLGHLRKETSAGDPFGGGEDSSGKVTVVARTGVRGGVKGLGLIRKETSAGGPMGEAERAAIREEKPKGEVDSGGEGESDKGVDEARDGPGGDVGTSSNGGLGVSGVPSVPSIPSQKGYTVMPRGAILGYVDWHPW